jgi:kynurenine formamidase
VVSRSGTARPSAGLGTNWLRWGADDRHGTLNLIDGEKIISALALAAHGRVIDIGYPIAADEPVQPHKRRASIRLVPRQSDKSGRGSLDGEIKMRIHSGTHIDSLSHYWTGQQLYNGVSRNEVVAGLDHSLSAEEMPAIITRAVFVDLAAGFEPGEASWGDVITVTELRNAMDQAGCVLEPGDALLIRTGWSRVWSSDPGCYLWGEPGLGLEAAEWIAKQDVCLVGADNWAVEAIPPEVPNRGLPVHEAFLGRYGILIMENLCLDELAKNGPGAYLLITTPLRIAGASGSPVRPIVIT